MILDIYKDSLEYSAKDLKTLLILGVTYFLSFLLLPLFLIYGYSYRVTKISVEGMILYLRLLTIFHKIWYLGLQNTNRI